MDVVLDCPWCPDGVLSAIADAYDDLVCAACNTRVVLAPDPVTSVAPAREAA
jgi:hypothetical protein